MKMKLDILASGEVLCARRCGARRKMTDHLIRFVCGSARVAAKVMVAASLPVVIPTTFIVTITVGSALVLSVGCGALGFACCTKLCALYHQQFRLLSGFPYTPLSEATVLIKALDLPSEITLLELPHGSQENGSAILVKANCANIDEQMPETSNESSAPLLSGDQEEEKKIREVLSTIKRVLGVGESLRGSIAEEIVALCLFTGLEPPYIGNEVVDMEKVKEELSLLSVIIGVKSD